MRTFVQYDAEGRVMVLLQTESVPEGRAHPFRLDDPTHGALEVTDENVARLAPEEISDGFRVDVAAKKLLKKAAKAESKPASKSPKPASKRGAKKTSKKK